MNAQFYSYLLAAFYAVALAIGQIIFRLVGTRITCVADLFH